MNSCPLRDWPCQLTADLMSADRDEWSFKQFTGDMSIPPANFDLWPLNYCYKSVVSLISHDSWCWSHILAKYYFPIRDCTSFASHRTSTKQHALNCWHKINIFKSLFALTLCHFFSSFFNSLTTRWSALLRNFNLT